jgi:UDP-N-acetylglucosamine--N-acetylmuramyl-(pentapeptide) pyrophosphoryl-undecaprenol N-acetylglucosamine transferase
MAAVLVPYPFAADDHQRRNGEILAAAGAAQLILDRELDGPRLAEVLRPLLGDPVARGEMAARSRAFGRPQAAAHVASVCAEVLEDRST